MSFRTLARIIRAAAPVIHTFGGLILYWVALLTIGIKAAITVGFVFVGLEAVWRLRKRQTFQPLWLIGNGAVLLLGLIDLFARTPFMLRYEGAIINLATAGAFALGALGPEPLVLRLARKRRQDIPADRPEIVSFFRAFTILWSVYFLARAGVSVWIMTSFPLARALPLRALVGWVSLGAMMLLSYNGRMVFKLCQRLGW